MTSTPAPDAATRATGPWARLPIAAKVVVVVLAAALAVNLFARFIDDSTGGSGSPGGRPVSSYATQPDGIAAYADLLGREGHPVERTRQQIAKQIFDPTTTVVVLEPDTLDANDVGVLLAFVVNGGRLVVGGTQPAYLGALGAAPPEWSPGGPDSWNVVDPSLAPITRIAGAGAGRFVTAGAGTAIVGNGVDALVVQSRVGRGTIDFVADSSPFQNRYLASADNAALALTLAGEPGRTVVFPEFVHGYGPARGLAAIPTDWKIALVVLALAALVLMWARGRRLGPPEDESRPLPPPRAAYVDALGSTLARTHRPAPALEIVARTVRARVGERAERDEFARRAKVFGLSQEEIDAVLAPITDEHVLALGHALSRVEQATRRSRA